MQGKAAMTGAPIVLILDDDAAVREALILLLASAGLASQGFASAGELLRSDQPSGPTCILLDLNLPDLDGLEVQKRLKQETPGVPVIFLTGHGDVPKAVQALKGGALDFFQKPKLNHQSLLSTINKGLANHRAFLAEEAKNSRILQRIITLSHREHEVARLAALGKANKVIGAELGISERTVEVHRGRAMRKLGLRCAADLVRAEKVLAETLR